MSNLKDLIVRYDVVDVSGSVLKTFDSKNQADKFKKQFTSNGYYGVKVVKSRGSSNAISWWL